MEEDELSLDMDDDDLDSDESSKDDKEKKPVEDSSFTTENIVNYGKEYEKLNKIYSKKEIMAYNKILDFKKLNKLNGELDSYKKEKINWQYLYNNVFRMILLPINLNKVDINKNISIHEISQRIRYCVHCIETMKGKNVNDEKRNLIPKIIRMFNNDKKKSYYFQNKIQNIFDKENGIKDNDLKRSNSHENFLFDDNVIKEENIINNNGDNKIGNNNNDENANVNRDNNNINISNKNSDNLDNKIENNNNNNNENFIKDNNNKNTNNNDDNKEKTNQEENTTKKRKEKPHITITLGKKPESNTISKSYLLNKQLRKSNVNSFNTFKKLNQKTTLGIILENIEKKNEGYDNVIKNVPKMSDDILFDTKQKKPNIEYKKNAFLETMNEFNMKNLNLEIKDKTFCENFTYFPIKQTYDKENDLEKRGERILSYKKMSDDLMELLDI